MNSEEVIIEFSDEEGQTRLLKDEGKDFLYMLMPIRLTAQDFVSDDDSVDIITPAQPEELDDNDESYSSSDYEETQESEPQEEPHDEEQEHTEEPF